MKLVLVLSGFVAVVLFGLSACNDAVVETFSAASEPASAMASSHPGHEVHLADSRPVDGMLLGSTYVCPMHPDVHGKMGDTCPVCKMNLVASDNRVETMPSVVADGGEHLPPRSDGGNYVCPMHPHVHGETGDRCGICGMDLVKSQQDSPPSHRQEHVDERALPAISLNDLSRQLVGLHTEKVKFGRLENTVSTLGIVTYNDDKTFELIPRAKGWVETLYVDEEGTRVKTGDTLLEYYSPEIASAQDGYLLSIKANYALPEERQQYIKRLAREKLGLFGIPERIVDAITVEGRFHQTIPLEAEQDGIVTRIDVEKDDYVSGNSAILVISDLKSVWVNFDLFEYQVAELKSGDSVTITSASQPGKSWVGKISFIYPELSERTNTIRVRAEVNVPDEALRPNTRVNVAIEQHSQMAAMTVPTNAVIPDKSGFRVVTKVGEDMFRPVWVTIGRESGSDTEILEGLNPDDEVVTSGQFLLDSESSLRYSFRAWQG